MRLIDAVSHHSTHSWVYFQLTRDRLMWCLCGYEILHHLLNVWSILTPLEAILRVSDSSALQTKSGDIRILKRDTRFRAISKLPEHQKEPMVIDATAWKASTLLERSRQKKAWKRSQFQSTNKLREMSIENWQPSATAVALRTDYMRAQSA
jgi:hypothetical protein